MITVRLLLPLKHDHIELPEGMIISLPAEAAHKLVMSGIAVMAEPERAVVQPQETRVTTYRNRKART
jgi:hypothetical protein